MKHFIVAIALLSAIAAARSQETCGYCAELGSLTAIDIQERDLPIETLREVLLDPAGHALAIHLKARVPVAELVRTSHVCEGAVFDTKRSINLYKNWLHTEATISFPYLRICEGKLVPLDEYREKPFKKFFDGEKKAFLERLNRISANVSPERIDERLKMILDDEKGPLTQRKAQWITTTAENAAQLIAKNAVKPKPKPKP